MNWRSDRRLASSRGWNSIPTPPWSLSRRTMRPVAGARRRSGGDEEADLSADGRWIGRFGQATVDTAVAGEIDDRPVRSAPGQQDLDDGVGVLEDLVEEAEQLRALHPGQVLVDDENVDLRERLDTVDGFDAARRGVNRVDVPKGPLELFEVGEVVVDDEDNGLGARLGLFHLLSRHLGSGLPAAHGHI